MVTQRGRWRRRAAAAGALVAAVVAVAGCAAPAPVPTPSTAEADAAAIITTVVASGLDAPWSIAFHDGTALVSERDGARIVEIGEAGGIREVGRIDGVRSGGEGGLLGIAVHDGQLYTYVTAEHSATGGPENRIERRRIDGSPGALSLGEPETVIDGIPAAGNHNGGRIAFGPDGMLYATTGDAGDRESAQDPEALSGKILRLTPTEACPTTTRSGALRSSASGTATRRGSDGIRRARCTRASSDRTRGTS